MSVLAYYIFILQKQRQIVLFWEWKEPFNIFSSLFLLKKAILHITKYF